MFINFHMKRKKNLFEIFNLICLMFNEREKKEKKKRKKIDKNI